MAIRTLLAAAASSLFAVATVACGGDGGGWSAYPVIIYEGQDSSGVTNIFTIDPASGETEQITFGDGFDGQPQWYAERERVLFKSDRDSGDDIGDIYTMAADGSDVRRLTDTPDVDEFSPKFSAEGDRIAYSAVRDGDYYIGLMDADGSNARDIAGPYPFTEFPAWSPDGEEIYFAAIGPETRAADILSVNIETREVRTRISTASSDVCPHFTRDGKFLTYASPPRGDPSAAPDIFEHDLSSGDTTGANDRQLTDHPDRDDYANPSPDGKTFVFLSMREGNFELFLMDRDGGNQRRLTNTPAVRENVPDW